MASFSAAARNRMLDTLNTELGSTPKFRVYTGTIPTNADTALGAQTLLADIDLPTNPFSAAASGAIALAAAADDSAANAGGTAAWGSFTKSDGTTRVLDVAIPAEVDFNTETFTLGELIRLATCTVSLPASV